MFFSTTPSIADISTIAVVAADHGGCGRWIQVCGSCSFRLSTPCAGMGRGLGERAPNLNASGHKNHPRSLGGQDGYF